jgi:hypothetical protein
VGDGTVFGPRGDEVGLTRVGAGAGVETFGFPGAGAAVGVSAGAISVGAVAGGSAGLVTVGSAVGGSAGLVTVGAAVGVSAGLVTAGTGFGDSSAKAVVAVTAPRMATAAAAAAREAVRTFRRIAELLCGRGWSFAGVDAWRPRRLAAR